MSVTRPRQRIAQLITLFHQHRSLQTGEVMQKLSVSQRVALDDLKALGHANILAHVGIGRNTRWSLQPGFRLEKFSYVDQIAFRLGQWHLGFLAPTLLGEAFSAADPRLAPSAPQRVREHLSQKLHFIGEPARDYSQHVEIFDELVDALFRTKRLSFTYKRRGAIEHHEALCPLTLVIYRRSAYLLASAKPTGESARLFALDRVQTAQVGEAFVYPTGWAPEAHFGDCFGLFTSPEMNNVVLRFAAERAHLVLARRWHATATTTVLKDGRVEVRMHTGGPELVRFVLEWGDKCEVIAPASLRAAVVAELRRALEVYEG